MVDAEFLVSPLDELQWSRFFSKRKIFCREEKKKWKYRFNGAAFFQSGKYPLAEALLAASKRFNGAAFFQSGKFR